MINITRGEEIRLLHQTTGMGSSIYPSKIRRKKKLFIRNKKLPLWEHRFDFISWSKRISKRFSEKKKITIRPSLRERDSKIVYNDLMTYRVFIKILFDWRGKETDISLLLFPDLEETWKYWNFRENFVRFNFNCRDDSLSPNYFPRPRNRMEENTETEKIKKDK